MTIFVNIQKKKKKNMWHKKLLESINWTHYLQDVIKLDGEALRTAHDLVMSHPARVYEDYVKMKPLNKGYLATNLLNIGIIPSGEPLPPLALTINEVEWAITHNYVHPREVVVIKYKNNISLLKDISNDVLLTLLNSTNSESDVRMFHYLETELAFRNGDNPDFEDFTVKSSENKAFMDLKQANMAETKAARYLYLELPKIEEAQPELPNPFQSVEQTLSSFGIGRTTARTTRINSGGGISYTDRPNNETSSVNMHLMRMPRLRFTNIDPVVDSQVLSSSALLITGRIFNAIIFKTPGNRVVIVPIVDELASLLTIVDTNFFCLRDLGGIPSNMITSSLLGEYSHLDEVSSSNGFFVIFTSAIQRYYPNTGG